MFDIINTYEKEDTVSLPRHLIFKKSFSNSLELMNLGVITSFLRRLRLFHCFGYLCIDL